jgi:hypothetical protein
MIVWQDHLWSRFCPPVVKSNFQARIESYSMEIIPLMTKFSLVGLHGPYYKDRGVGILPGPRIGLSLWIFMAE